ncbi:glycosyltransferase family 25 protein [Burkholderia sp. BCC1644]|uniref:glycosyltransferase family 25 protein n=1 Tax=Burkholderia sp. BCC1644 TaxID=2676293 RepID=UPI001ABA4DB2|nr:glycosyltransferase family 25 protein [Burkholderia sp. BCC1644]
MNLLANFDRIYIINLRTRTDRRRQIVRELARAGFAHDDARIRFFDAICPDVPDGFPGIGARGCYLSHLGVLREARDAGLANVLVLEDDAVFEPALERCGAAMVDTLRLGAWDFAYVGHVETCGVDVPGWHRTDRPLVCAHCYAVNGPALAPLVAFLEACVARAPGDPLGGPMHVDGALSMFRAARAGCRTLLAVPSLARQRSSRSDIATGRWFDRAGPLRGVVAGARCLKEWLWHRRHASS